MLRVHPSNIFTARNASSTRVVCALALLMFHGCASWDPETRAIHIQTHREALEATTREVLAAGETFDLDRCIQTALQNNLQIKAAEIQARIAELDRKTAFASFLPSLRLNADYTAWDRQPESVMFGLLSSPIQDQEMWGVNARAELPIFEPTSWFLYAQYVRGAEIGEFILDYTRQMMSLRVTTLYFQCLALEEAEKALESQLEAAETLHSETAAHRKEGLVSQWQADQAAALVLQRRTVQHWTQGALYDRKANLLATMGISPFAEISLTSEAPLRPPEGKPEDLILQALLANPQLHIADREVAIQEEWVKTAIAAFLPDLSGFAIFRHSSNSFLAFPTSWVAGLESAFTVFSGFADVNQYRAAREKEKAAYVQREEASLTVMLQVVHAYLSMLNAQEELALAEKTMDVATGRFTEIEAQWKEGLVNPSARLETLAGKNGAQMEVMQARFQHQVAIATLMNVLGLDPVGCDGRECEDEDES